MSGARRAAGWAARGLAFKLLAPLLPFILLFSLIGGLVAFLLMNTAVVGWQQQQEIENASATCTSGVEATGGDSGTVNVPAEYAELIKKAAKDTGLPEQIVAAQIQAESNFNPQAGSGAGAKGLAQFIDSTFQKYVPGGDPYKPEDAMKAYTGYINDLKDMFKGRAGDDATELTRLVLAAYNAGPGAVEQYDGVPPYPETQGYVKKILGSAQVKFSEGCKQVSGAKAWDGDLGDGEWTNPCPGCQFTSPYGWRNVFPPGDWRNEHVGTDLATPGLGEKQPGVQIIAPTDMKVVGFLPSDGCVTAKQNGAPGFQFNFCHLESWDVQQGQELKRGDIIGVEGGTAGGVHFAYATHLHFEIYKPDSPVPAVPYNGFNLDPEPILKEKGAWVDG